MKAKLNRHWLSHHVNVRWLETRLCTMWNVTSEQEGVASWPSTSKVATTGCEVSGHAPYLTWNVTNPKPTFDVNSLRIPWHDFYFTKSINFCNAIPKMLVPQPVHQYTGHVINSKQNLPYNQAIVYTPFYSQISCIVRSNLHRKKYEKNQYQSISTLWKKKSRRTRKNTLKQEVQLVV